jgi:hypothetical protein
MCKDHGLYRILSSYWLAHFNLMKKSARVLDYFGLDCSKKSLMVQGHYVSIIHVHCRLCTVPVQYIIGAIPGGLLSGQILLSSLRSIQLEVSCTQCNWLGSPQKTEFQILKVC